MDREQFKNLYNILFEQKDYQKQKNDFLIQFTIQNSKFTYYKNYDKKYVCKFSFLFLDELQKVTVQFNSEDSNLEFVMTDEESEVEQKYNLKKFKYYFPIQYEAFKQSFEKFKEFLNNKKKIKTQNNTLKIVPLQTLLNSEQNVQKTVTIDDVKFTVFEIPNSFHDTFRIDFEINQINDIDFQKYVTVIFKTLSNQNYYILEIYLYKQKEDIQEATIIDKDQFYSRYPSYFTKLSKAIKAFLQMNN